MTLTLAHPFSKIYDSRSDVVLQFQDHSSPQVIANWVGLPLTGMVVERSRVATVPVTQEFNIVHEGDNGRLLVGSDRIEWQDLKHTDKSRTWTYSQIKSFQRATGGREFKIKPYSGDDFEFKAMTPDLRDDVYNMIADRTLAARR